jgi:hypothetical protein
MDESDRDPDKQGLPPGCGAGEDPSGFAGDVRKGGV